MKSAVAAFLSVLVALGLGLALYAALDAGRGSGRNPWPLIACAAGFLVVGGLVFRRFFHTTALACLLGLGIYVSALGAAIAWLGGTGDARFFAEWFFGLLAATLVPWIAGFFAARFVPRPSH